MMTIVERILPGFQWADPPSRSGFDVEQLGTELRITGLLPRYKERAEAYDLLQLYEIGQKRATLGQKRAGRYVPHIRFANADSDQKLIAFLRQFGPVVATRVANVAEHAFAEPGWRPRISAWQDLEELINERVIYRATLGLILELRETNFDSVKARGLIAEIAAGVDAWPKQWERERAGRNFEPSWRLAPQSLKRIRQLGTGGADLLLPPAFDARIVVCELLNAFRATIYPNPVELHSSIRYGIRPLLYSILRREFLHPRATEVCENTQCRNFFEIERKGQRFCGEDCSRKHRQRDYWRQHGKRLRRDRLKKRQKAR